MNWKRTALLLAALGVLAFSGAGLIAEDEEDLMPEVRQALDTIERWPVWQHVELTSALRRSFDERMLTPKRKWLAEYADLTGKAGVARLLHRGLYEKDTQVRGGGAYFSFTSRTNDYNQGPDIELQQGDLSSGFYGGTIGYVVELSTSNLRKVESEAVPEWMRKSAAVMFKNRRREVPAKAAVGKVYAVRAIRESEADTLTAVKILDLDADGASFAWRVLIRYPVWSRR